VGKAPIPQPGQNVIDPGQQDGVANKTLDIASGGSGTHLVSGSSATPAIPQEVLWPLCLTPDIDWDFAGADFQHITEGEEASSTTGDGDTTRTPALTSCTSVTHETLPQVLDTDREVDHATADTSIDRGTVHRLTQILQRADPSLISSSLTTELGSHSWRNPSLNLSRQGSKSPSREYFINSVPISDLPTSFLLSASAPNRQWSGARSSLTNAFVAPNRTSVPSESGFSTYFKDSNTLGADRDQNHDTKSSCQCLAIMLNTLENIGGQGLDGGAHEIGTGLDEVLSSLACGIRELEQVINCGQCDTCTENRRLLATVAQQLSSMAGSFAACLPPQDNLHESGAGNHQRQDHRASIAHLCESFLDSANNEDVGQNTSGLLEGGIYFGRFKVHNPGIRSQMVYHVLLLYIGQLREVLACVKDRVGSSRGARKLLIVEQLKVKQVWDLFHLKTTCAQ
jgi:hypothetical protein